MDNFLGTIGLAMRAGKIKCGAWSTAMAIENGSGKLVVAAKDIGSDNKRRIENLCARYGVPLVYHATCAELSQSVGKKNIPVVCICDDNFAAAARKYNIGKDGMPNG